MKVVINTCFGGFGLSHEAILLYAELKGLKVWLEESEYKSFPGTYWTVPVNERPKTSAEWNSAPIEERKAHIRALESSQIYDRDLKRNDPFLVEVVEKLGDKANGSCAKLAVIEIPDDVEWEVEEYDGIEHIAEVHETWG